MSHRTLLVVLSVLLLAGVSRATQPPRTQATAAKAAPPAAGKAEVNILQLKNAVAPDMVKLLQQLFPDKDGRSLRLVADPRTNSVIAMGPRDQLDVIEAILQKLDESSKDREEGRLEIIIVPLKHAAAVELVKVLRDVYQGKQGQGLVLAADPNTNSVIVRGIRDQLDEIKVLITGLDMAVEKAKPEPKKSPDKP